MAAYAGLVTLMHTIDTIEHHHSPPICIDKQQVESLTQIVTFLQEFLECYKSPVADGDEADPLEMRIADAAYAVEDVIESYIVNVIELELFECCDSSSDYTDVADLLEMPFAAEEVNSREEVSCIDFYQDLQQVIEEMNVIKKEAMETSVEAQPQRKVSLTLAGSSTSSSNVKESIMVGFDDVQLQLLDRLTGGNRNRQIIPITGMGGIGKTTLARHIFEHALVKEHFHIRAWTTISQTYNVRETLSQVLHQVTGNLGSDLSENELGIKLLAYLWGRRYLIILDDMWSVEVWEKIMVFFSDNNNGSRVIVTTRLSNLAAELIDSNSIGMRFLDDVCSWSLFSKIVFGGEDFPLHLEEIGKKIVGKCKGLPLSIVVIGGLLAKSELTLEYWEHIEKNLSSIVNSENDEYWLRVLKLSYDHLPAYLKPCFLYIGMFGEDEVIRTAQLMRLWVSEGFLKPIINKSLETIANEYLKELVDRNLILVHRLGAVGNIKYCKMQDLLRDLCLKEAEKQRFYYVLGQHCPQGINSQRRIVIPRSTSDTTVKDAMETRSSRARSFICYADTVPELLDFRFLRTLSTYKYSGGCLDENVFQMVNLRYLRANFRSGSQIPSSISLLWNLHTLIVTYKGERTTAPVEIWKMDQLKHVEFGYPGMYLPDPRSGHSDVMMENLETLKGVLDLNLNEEVVKRIPNIKKLWIIYKDKVMERVKCLSYLQCLSKLESLRCFFGYGSDAEYLQSISFPHSLKKLYLKCRNFHLEEILEKIASLPLLEKLILYNGQFATRSWEIVEGQFPSLKYLRLDECMNMECWTLEGSCLPRLEQLHLWGMKSLEEFPSEIGEIATLKSIQLYHCSESMAVSLKKIVEEQKELQGDPPFHVLVESRKVSQELQSLETEDAMWLLQIDEYDQWSSSTEVELQKENVAATPVENQGSEPTSTSDSTLVPDAVVPKTFPVDSSSSSLSIEIKDIFPKTSEAKISVKHETEIQEADEPRTSTDAKYSGEQRETEPASSSNAKTSEHHEVSIASPIYFQEEGHYLVVLKDKHLRLELINNQSFLIGDSPSAVKPMLSLVEKDLHELPEKPNYPNSLILLLQRNKRLSLIHRSFFDTMPDLSFLDMSDTKIRNLPSSLFELSKLKVLLLRNCICLEKLPPEVRKLSSMEALDLSGTELYELPDEIGELTSLRSMQLSFYGPDDESEYDDLPSRLVSPSFLSELKGIEALSVSVHPEDQRWTESVAGILKDISRLDRLSYLHFYFPRVETFERFIQTSPSWKKQSLRKFEFTVGQNVKRIASRVPDEVKSLFSQEERCLRYVNGDKVSPLIKSVLTHVTSFYLDHHTEAQSLSEFDNCNFHELKFYLVRECPKMQAILDEENAGSAFPCLEYLGIYFLWELKQVWKPAPRSGRLKRIFKTPTPLRSFEALRFLIISTCPKLCFILRESMLQCFANLEELIVEDCEHVEKIIKEENKKVKRENVLLPRLRKLVLRYLPELVGLGCGIRLSKEEISVYGCPKLIPNS